MNNKQSNKMAKNNDESQISTRRQFQILFHTLHTEVERSFIEILPVQTPLSLSPLYTPFYIFCCGIIKFE